MEESQNTGTVTKDDSFQIRQKVEDMIDYMLNAIPKKELSSGIVARH